MPNVVIPFLSKRDTAAKAAPRHRRDGFFDEQDQWHDAAEALDHTSQQVSS
jgi:uncharacterized protein YukE